MGGVKTVENTKAPQLAVIRLSSAIRPCTPSLMESPERDRHTIFDGRPQLSASDSTTFSSIDPCTGQPICTIHTSSRSAIASAIASAQAAFPVWSRLSAIERARILHRAVTLLRSRNDTLARIETLDTGKPLSETSTVDVVTGADVLEYYASLVASGGLDGKTTRLRTTAVACTTKEPLGVCAAIGAWNYPLQIALWKSAPCLAAGNVLVYKPSEYTPLHAEYLADLFKEAGVPDGVFNVVYGAGDVGAALTVHPAVQKVSFTGQVSTGKMVAAAAAGSIKAVTLELGGKSPLIVLPDVDLGQAADGAMMANFYSTGQVCTNGTRVFVPRSMKAAFEGAVLKRMKHVRVGDPYDMTTNFGPLSSRVQHEKVRRYIDHGIEKDKATLLCGGVHLPPDVAEHLRRGYWILPTVFTDCHDDMRIVREEIFGPVMCILAYDTVDEAIERANRTELGLAAGVFSRDVSLCHQVVSRLEAGIIWVNTWGESPAEMSVGGWKLSGLGVENGKRGLEAWVRSKSTLLDTDKVPTVFAKL